MVVIVLQKDTTNIVVVTLAEKQTLTDPYFLFEFQNDQTDIKYACIASDTSVFKARYNKFSITEGADPDLTGNEIQLGVDGFYRYWIYEQSSPINLDPTQATALLETGKMLLLWDAQENDRYEPGLTNTINQ